MPHVGAVFAADGFSLDGLTTEQVRFGVVLRLPFRLRVAGLIQAPLPDPELAVWLYNAVPIPPGSHLPAILSQLPDRRTTGYAALWTQAVVFVNQPTLSPGALEALKAGDARNVHDGSNYFRALTGLNEVIYAYSEVVQSIFGGAGLRFLSDMDFFGALRVELTFLAPPDYSVTAKDVREILEWRPEREIVSLGGQLTGELTDLSEATFADLPGQIIKLRKHAFHELAFKAKMSMVAREPFVALVLACAALEGAHAAFLRQKLLPSLESDRHASGLIENLLREQGIYTMVQLTSRVFMPSKDQPTAEALEACLSALTMRNDIVHAKQKKGSYRIREHTFKELSDAYVAVLKIFDAYGAALGRGEGG